MQTLRVLLVDDSEDDALMLKYELQRSGYTLDMRRVDTAAGLRDALQNGVWDIVILDYMMPKFNAPAAMEIYHEYHLDIPCIVLSGQVTDDNAITLMRAGARDFIPKHQRSRLLPAIERELNEFHQRREREQTKYALVESQRRHAMIFRSSSMAIWEEDFSELWTHLEQLRNNGVTDLRNYLDSHPDQILYCASLIHILDINPAALILLAADSAEQIIRSLDKVFSAASLHVFREELCAVWEHKPSFHHEAQHVRLDGTEITVIRSLPIPQNLEDAHYVPVSMLDITDLRQAHQANAAIASQTQLILDTAGEGIFGLDRNGRHTFINAAATHLLGYSVDELIGLESHATWHGLCADGTPYSCDQCPICMVLHYGESRQGEEYFMRRDGSMFPVDFIATPLFDNGQIQGAVVSFRDITDRKESEIVLLESNRALNTLSQCNQILIHATEEGELFNGICQVLENTGGYAATWISLTGDGVHFLKPIASSHHTHEFIHAIARYNRLDAVGNNPEREALVNSRACQAIDLQAWNCIWKDEAAARGYHSCISIPLKENHTLFGTLSVCIADNRPLMPGELEILEELAGDTAFGIQTIRTRHERDAIRTRLSQVMLQTIQAIATTVEKRDPYTAGHQQRVSQLAVKIATEIGLIEDQVEGVRLGGIIHDIGKIYVPAEILSRPGLLTETEFMLIKSHPQVGYDILKDIQFPWPIQDMVLQHHERMNGSGYPAGLHAEAICLEARILAVADVVESINSHRPYRAALGIDTALKEIRAGANTLYDPGIVQACCEIIQRDGLPWD